MSSASEVPVAGFKARVPHTCFGRLTYNMRALVPLSMLLVGASGTATPPSLDSLASIWQPFVQAVNGAPSVTNCWGSVLASSANVLGLNALEAAPFSSGWDSENLYGWATDTATLSVGGARVAPTASLWTPYSVLRNGSGGGKGAAVLVTTELRWVFEAQALMLEANVSLADGGATASVVEIDVDLRLPLRYFPRADMCPSWHYPTASHPCCWNWFPPASEEGDGEAVFVPSWHACGSAGAPLASLTSTDVHSSATTAWSFPGACSAARGRGNARGPARLSAHVHNASDASDLSQARADVPGSWVELGAPDAATGTVASWSVSLGGASPSTARLRLALVFSNASDPMSTATAARDLADAFPSAWADARTDWQARFDSAFDPALGHFSGSLPIVDADGPTGDAAATRIYYESVISLLAIERTNYPPPLPGGPCMQKNASAVDDYAESWEAAAPSAAPPRGLSRVLRARDDGLVPRVRGCAFSGGGSSADFNGGASASRALRAALESAGGRSNTAHSALDPSVLLAEAGAPWRTFMSGGGMNTTTNIFYWDVEYAAQLLAMLEPDTLARTWVLWTASVDSDSQEESQWAFWGYDYAAQRGVGNYYSTNDAVLFTVADAIARVSGSSDFFNVTYLVGPYANGSSVETTVFDTVRALAGHWRAPRYNASGFLADYGLAENLLECVPTYMHRVASINAGNAFMATALAPLVAARGDEAGAAALRADAAGIAAQIVRDLYVGPNASAPNSGGYFRALFPNGSAPVVRHVMDFVYVLEWLGVAGTARAGFLAPHIADEMAAFVARELEVPGWMRALSLNDTAAPFSNRSDHGPSGAFTAWPALTARGLAMRGTEAAYAAARDFLDHTLWGAELGAYGQAIEVRPPGDPYKPMAVTLYNGLGGSGFADTVIQTLFGVRPLLVLPGEQPPAPEAALLDADVPRGFNGFLRGVRFGGALWDVTSGAGGLSIAPHENFRPPADETELNGV